MTIRVLDRNLKRHFQRQFAQCSPRNLWVLFLFVLFFSPSLYAVDRGDVYVEVQGNLRFDTTAEMAGGAVVGFSPVDSFGFGVALTQIYSLREFTEENAGYMLGLDARWFLEPFEVYAGTGGFWGLDGDFTTYVSGGGVYLVAITPSLALKLDLWGRYLIGRNTIFYAGLGGRLVF